MKNILVLIAIFCVITSNAQNKFSDTITVENQYQVAVEDAEIKVEGSHTTFTTNKQGKVYIELLNTDKIAVSKEGYDSAYLPLTNIKQKTLTVHKNFHWKDLLTPMFYIINGGLWLILLIVFAETGLFVGFFLPGDSLLFVAGIYSNELVHSILPFIDNAVMQLLLLMLLIAVAGILGNSVGYWFGRKVGPAMYGWKDNLLFKQKYLTEAHDFYEKHGGGAIIIARFLPIVRTFAPIVAGIVNMQKTKFTFFNIIGCFAWVFSMLFAGHFLQKWIYSQFNFDLKKHLEIIVIGIVLVTTAPVILKLVLGKKKK